MKRFQEKTAGILNSADLKTFKGKFVYWLFFAILIAICVVCVLPTVWAVFSSFKTSSEIYTSMSFFPEVFTWDVVKERFVDALSLMDAVRTSINTLIVSIGQVIFALVFGGLGGYVLSRLKPSGSKFIFVLVTWTMMMPTQIGMVPQFISYLDFPFVAKIPGEVSILNTYWPMWLGAAANTFNIILFKNHFDSISISYVEAARLDGCNNARIFFNIMVPLSGPILIYVAIMTMKGAWADFFTPYLTITKESMYTLPQKIYLLSNDTSVKMNTYMLSLVLSAVPMLILFIIFQKQIIGGVNVGGVKG